MADPCSKIVVRVEPAGILLECEPGEAIMMCAWRNGYYWPTICGGIGECGACRCEIVEGQDHAEPLEHEESVMFRLNPRMLQSERPVRLACCLKANGPMTVVKNGVKPR